jgi:hypothetical protein
MVSCFTRRFLCMAGMSVATQVKKIDPEKVRRNWYLASAPASSGSKRVEKAILVAFIYKLISYYTLKK